MSQTIKGKVGGSIGIPNVAGINGEVSKSITTPLRATTQSDTNQTSICTTRPLVPIPSGAEISIVMPDSNQIRLGGGEQNVTNTFIRADNLTIIAINSNKDGKKKKRKSLGYRILRFLRIR